MIRDPNTGIVGPCVFAMINAKNGIIYEEMINEIRNIIFKVNDWEPLTITIDYESALQNSIEKAFPKAKIIGCLFHFKQSLFRKATELGLMKCEIKENTNQLINTLSSLSWLSESEKYQEVLDDIKNTLTFDLPNMQEFFDYFVGYWVPKFLNGQIDYSNIDQNHRSNSILESWHSKITDKLPLFPSWSIFLEFLKVEENNFCEDV